MPSTDVSLPHPSAHDDLCSRSATDLVAALRTGEVTSTEVVQAHLERIERYNPLINAVVTVVPERALEEARKADEMRDAGVPLPPLHGLPVLIKDSHDTEGIRTTYGSRLFQDNVPAQDELVVARIRAAGGIVLGKTNLPEFGAGSHTFNSVFGVTRNPYDLSRSAGGSSGGSAAAVAAGFAPLADGSDFGGSLRNPTSFCGVVGLRPSLGRVPTLPAKLPYFGLTVQGPIGRSVADVALMLSVLAGPDERSPLALPEPGATFAPPVMASPASLRIAYAPRLGGLPIEDDVVQVLDAFIATAEAAGHRIRRAEPDLDGAEEAFRTLRAWEFITNLGDELQQYPDFFKPSLAENIRAGERLSARDVGRAEIKRGIVYRAAVDFFADYDVLICPAAQVVPFPVELEYPVEIAGQPQHDYLEWMRVAYWITVTGCPVLSLPVGRTQSGLPIGAQVVARPRSDAQLLSFAAALETLVALDQAIVTPSSFSPDLASPTFAVQDMASS